MGGTPAHPATHHRNTHDMTQDEIKKVQQALMAADLFYYAIPNGRRDVPSLGRVLADAIDITTKHTDK